MVKRDNGPAISCLDLLAEDIFVLLSCTLNQGDQGNEAEKEQELVLVSPDGVHAIQRKWLRETLISHVKGAKEREVCHSTQNKSLIQNKGRGVLTQDGAQGCEG